MEEDKTQGNELQELIDAHCDTTNFDNEMSLEEAFKVTDQSKE